MCRCQGRLVQTAPPPRGPSADGRLSITRLSQFRGEQYILSRKSIAEKGDTHHAIAHSLHRLDAHGSAPGQFLINGATGYFKLLAFGTLGNLDRWKSAPIQSDISDNNTMGTRKGQLEFDQRQLLSRLDPTMGGRHRDGQSGNLRQQNGYSSRIRRS